MSIALIRRGRWRRTRRDLIDWNIARRPHWPDEMFITVQPFEDHEIAAMGEWVMSHGVFFDDGAIEYGSPAEDMSAGDWLVGRAAV